MLNQMISKPLKNLLLHFYKVPFKKLTVFPENIHKQYATPRRESQISFLRGIYENVSENSLPQEKSD